MPAIILYFQVHQPYRLRPYTVFDLGENHVYEDTDVNCDIVRKAADMTYLPMNALLLEEIQKRKGKFKVSFSITGTALDQFEECAPDVLDSFRKLIKTGNVELISEPYAHSLACLYSRDEFIKQIRQHAERTHAIFGVRPTTFRNTELIYNNDLAARIEDLGYEVILTEGADHVLGWRSPNFVYQPVNCHKLRLLVRNYQLSDDITLRFSDQNWPGFPLTAEKFASWVHAVNTTGEVVNLFMDYETFGQRHSQESGIFDFMRALPEALLAHPDFCFRTPSDAAKAYQPVAKIDVPQYISWADAERDLTAWLGNDMQLDAIEALYKLEEKVSATASPELLKIWRRLQTADHFYYMSTKWFSDGDARAHINPYSSPYDAYINFMNVMADFELTVSDAAALAPAPDCGPDGQIVSAAPKTSGISRKTAATEEKPAGATQKKTVRNEPETAPDKPAAARRTRSKSPSASN